MNPENIEPNPTQSGVSRKPTVAIEVSKEKEDQWSARVTFHGKSTLFKSRENWASLVKWLKSLPAANPKEVSSAIDEAFSDLEGQQKGQSS